MHPITLDAAHVYTDSSGAVYDSVTSFLAQGGFVDDEWFTPESRLRGSYVHQAIDLDLQHDLAEPADDDPIRGYILAARRFLVEAQTMTLFAELPLADPTLRIAGTLDWLGQVHGTATIVDWKSGQPQPAHQLQLAAYKHLAFVNELGARFARATVYLRPDGTYKMVSHTDRHDWQIAQAALTLARWRSIHGC